MAKILLIDDRSVSLDQARAILRGDHWDLIEANDPLAGLHRAVEDAPACIVVALALPGMDGLEVCRRLVECESTRDIPVIVRGEVTAAQLGPLARRAGAFAYVDFARTPAALRGAVSRALADSGRIGFSRFPESEASAGARRGCA